MSEDKTNAPSQSNNDDMNDKGQMKTDPSEQLTPEHPRFKDVLNRAKAAEEKVASLQEQLESIQQQISTRQVKEEDDRLTDDEQASLNRINKELRKAGFVTQDDLRVQSRAAAYSKLADRHNGNDGLPSFVPVDVVSYAKENGFDADSEKGLEAAYRDMHFDAIVQQRSKPNTVEVPDSEKPGGKGATNPTSDDEFTQEDVAKMSPEQYEKNRAKILASIKPQRTIEY